jgi:N-acylneuraminate cytidylyltransferase
MSIHPLKTVAIAVIPARGGSKRLPGKNCRQFFGKPLVAYTIEAAKESGLFDRVIVSTDSKEIAEVALSFGADVPFLRDASLADDKTPVSQVTVNVIERLGLNGRTHAHVAQLMPNCPLRTVGDLHDSYRQFVDTQADSQISVTRFGWQNPWFAMLRDAASNLKPLFEERATQRTQDQPELFCKTGAIWWANSGVLLREGTYHIANLTGWEMPWQNAVDIDTDQDWEMAELLMRARLKKQ